MSMDIPIGDLAYNCFAKLGKSGKPNPESEYTVLAAIVCERKDCDNKSIGRQVVALTTGTKCQPSNWSSKQHLIVDSHAESLLKRAFKRYLISQLENGLKVDNLDISLFISQLPCGSLQRWKGDPNYGLNDTQTDRKPGRGEPCHKPTCLKKIAKWIYLGLQGKRLIECTKDPIYINNIVIGNCGQIGEYDEQMIKDLLALDANCVSHNPFKLDFLPQIKFCKDFRNDLFIKCNEKQSAPTALVMWLTGI
ncbi:unnamed protein product, partial [Medioppia subpectinata]